MTDTDPTYAVCDVVLDRLVVDTTHDTRDAATERADSSVWNNTTCDVQVVRVCGERPESGTYLDEDQIDARKGVIDE